MKFVLLLVALMIHVHLYGNNPAPNIIFVICDQMRGDAYGAAGNEEIHTPNIDRMAEDGVMFSGNFANNPVCLPSRISMFSGLYPHQTGIMNNKPAQGTWLKFERSLPWYLKQAGYKIGYIGKNHTFIGDELSHFDVVEIRDREEFRAYSKYVPPYWHSDVYWPEEDCHPGKNTRDAIQFIKESSGNQPFFLTVSYFDPHPPYMAPSEYTSRYCSADLTLPGYIDPARLGKRLLTQQKALHYDRIKDTDLLETIRYYYASIEWGVDHQIGQLIKALQDQGILDNTLVVFTSDHGDFMGQHRMVRKGMFLYDALLHVPLVWYGPGIIKKGLTFDQVTQNVDIFPTLLDFADIQIPDYLAGKSLKKILQGNEMPDDNRMIFASASYSTLPDDYWNNPEPRFNPDSNVPFHSRIERLTWMDVYKTSMIRNGNWKLIISETEEPELYYMNGGTTEIENLSNHPENKDRLQQMQREIEKIWAW